MLYKPVRPKRVADQVFEQLRDLIFRGQLKPGDQIPPERELAVTLGVSRPTVRQAVSKLANLGLVFQRQGQGTFVSRPQEDLSLNPLKVLMDDGNLGIRNLLEVRMGLECNSAMLAARRATQEDIRLMKTGLEHMQEEVSKGGLGHEEDLYFHMRLAFASKNHLQVQLMKHVYDLLAAGIKENWRHLHQKPRDLDSVLKHHRVILEAIERRDPDSAFKAMQEHITDLIKSFDFSPDL